MATNVQDATLAPFTRVTANDRLKSSFGSWFWGSVAVAALIHFALLALWPDMQAADYGFISSELEAIELPPEVEIPPPPEQIQRPQVPVLATEVNINEDLTIPETTFRDNPVTDLPPPPTAGTVDVSQAPTFTPYEVAPEFRDRAALQRLLQQKYPPTLRDAGIGGTVRVWVYINEQGQVQNTRVVESSGYPALDQAATEVMQAVRFTPALNRDQRVAVWVQFPVTFQVQ
ncbi:MAG: energy transducer TonB [Longimicrobiaceae bacterium]